MGTIKEHTTEIDGTTYKTKTFPAAEGLDLLPRLVSLAGDKALELFLTVTDEQAGALAGNAEVIAAIVTSMAMRAAQVDGGLSGLAKAILRHTTCDAIQIGAAKGSGNVAEHFDTHFAGRYKHLLSLCVWVVRVGFAAP